MSETPPEKGAADQPPGSPLQNFWEHSPIVMGFLFLVLTAFALGAILIPSDVVRVQPGQLAPRTIIAPFSFVWEDARSTEDLRKREIAKLPFCYRHSPQQGKKITDTLRLLQEILEEKKGSFYPPEEIQDPDAKRLQKAVAKLDPGIRRQLSLAFPRILPVMERLLRNGILSRTLKEESKYGQLISVRDLSNRVSSPFPMRELPMMQEALETAFREGFENHSRGSSRSGEFPLAACRSLAGLLAELVPEGNLEPDTAAMQKSREIARRMVKPVVRKVAEGEILLERRKVVTYRQAEQYEVFRKEMQKWELKAGNIAVNILRTVLILTATLLCLWSIHPKLMSNNRTLGLLTVLACAGITLNKLAVIFFNVLAKMVPSVPPDMLYYSLPVGMAVTLVSAFLGTRTALFTGFFLAIIASMHVPEPARMLVSGFLIAASTAIAVKGAANYRDFFVRTFLASYLTAFVVALLYLLHDPWLRGMILSDFLSGNRELYPIFWFLVLPVFSGLLTAVMGQILLYVSELLFDACTPMSLQLYSDRNHPLLMKLQMEAPGTYYHCLAVSQMAEKAANAIGADRMMAHVIGLYHDVGKLKQPLYFTENSPGVNRHEGLDPALSAVIILNHVKYGLEVARKYKLKKPIRKAIAQHHGDSMVAFFYEQAKVEAKRKDTTVDPKLFSYDGPRPVSKEISILMLADCCEAASRSVQDLTEEGILCLVSNIIDSKIRSGGQLEKSLLSVKELSIVRESLIETLSSQKHGRIAYPKDNKEKQDEDDLFVAAGEGKVSPGQTQKL